VKIVVRIFLVVALGLAVLSAGCMMRQVTYSGFLRDYSDFRPGPEGGADLIYIKKGVDFSQYNKIMMDHVLFWFHERADYRGIDVTELERLADAYHKAIAGALGDAYPLVGEAGPEVLRLRAAVTDVVPTRPAAGDVPSVPPVGKVSSAAPVAGLGTHADVGSATLEAELLDSQTGERLAAIVDKRAGGKYRPVEGVQKWSDAEQAFQFWAGRLRNWLDTVHGKE
jgi:hypothetical protein